MFKFHSRNPILWFSIAQEFKFLASFLSRLVIPFPLIKKFSLPYNIKLLTQAAPCAPKGKLLRWLRGAVLTQIVTLNNL